jgi:DNA-binding GntR family transcriptional regulator
MNDSNKILGYKSLAECVMDYLKKQIIDGELIPGGEINFKSLCETLGVSRTPVREALIQLMKDGFVEVLSRKAFRIKKLSAKDIKDMYFVGGLLEAEILKDAAENMTSDDIRKLEIITDHLKKAFKESDSYNYYLHNTAFNQFVQSFCTNRVLVDQFSKLRERLYFTSKSLSSAGFEEIMLKDHCKMTAILEKNDKKEIENFVKNDHWDFLRNHPYLKEVIPEIEDSESAAESDSPNNES